MGNGRTGATWVGLMGAAWIGVFSSTCDSAPGPQPLPSIAPPMNTPGGDTETPPSSMALEDAPPALGNPTTPPPPPPGAFLAQLSPDQVAQLTSLGVEVVVPGTVPPSFQVADLRISQGDIGLSYLIVYQNGENQCFAVEYADGGTSPPPATESRIPIHPPLFTEGGNAQDYGLNYGKFAAPDWQAKFPEPNLYTDWLAGSSGYYRLTGAADIKALLPGFGHCQDIAPETAVTLAESFTLITNSPREMF